MENLTENIVDDQKVGEEAEDIDEEPLDDDEVDYDADVPELLNKILADIANEHEKLALWQMEKDTPERLSYLYEAATNEPQRT